MIPKNNHISPFAQAMMMNDTESAESDKGEEKEKEEDFTSFKNRFPEIKVVVEGPEFSKDISYQW